MPSQTPSRRRSRTGPGSRTLAAALALALLAGSPVLAQEGATGGGEPVEIVADSLVVEQEKQLATFSGNVDAVQGDLRLRADRLLVSYAEGGEEAESSGQSIRMIEAIGNVFVTRPGEAAQGDRGTYEPATGEVKLEGNVVLTRGKNVIRGARLESNQETGVSTVFAATPGARGQPEQRVRALFQRDGGSAAAGGQTP